MLCAATACLQHEVGVHRGAKAGHANLEIREAVAVGVALEHAAGEAQLAGDAMRRPSAPIRTNFWFPPTVVLASMVSRSILSPSPRLKPRTASRNAAPARLSLTELKSKRSAPRPPNERVLPGAADQQVVALFALQPVRAAIAEQLVVAEAAAEEIHAGIAVDDIVAAERDDDVVAAKPVDRLAQAEGLDQVVPLRAVDRVGGGKEGAAPDADAARRPRPGR